MDDPRVQAIRCSGCGRLRPHPKTVGTLFCPCGHDKFYASFPMPGEEAWALTIYKRELKEAELWSARCSLMTWNR